MRLSEEIRTILLYSREEAARTGCTDIAPEHLLLAILRQHDNLAVEFLSNFGIDLLELKKLLDSRVFREQAVPFSEQDGISFTRKALEISSSAILEAILTGGDKVSAIHLLSALCDSSSEWCSSYLHNLGLSVELIRRYFNSTTNSSEKGHKLPSSDELTKLLGAFYLQKEEILS